MPPRHRFLEPIHNVKDGGKSPVRGTKPRSSGLHLWKHVSRRCSLPSFAPLELWRFVVAARTLRNGLASRSCIAAKAGGASRDRTDDLKLAKLALSQLSYGPSCARLAASFGGLARRGCSVKSGSPDIAPMERSLVGRVGVEPTTSRLSGVRSNHLSYRPPCQAWPATRAAGGWMPAQVRRHGRKARSAFPG